MRVSFVDSALRAHHFDRLFRDVGLAGIKCSDAIQSTISRWKVPKARTEVRVGTMGCLYQGISVNQLAHMSVQLAVCHDVKRDRVTPTVPSQKSTNERLEPEG